MEPVSTLGPRHREALTAHLLQLPAGDRAERFACAVGDDYIRRYVDGIGYGQDIVIGAMQDERVIALCHAPVYVDHSDGGALATEIGLSVDADLRGRGLGKALLLAAIDAAARRNVRRALAFHHPSNTAMAGLSRDIGARIENDGGAACAVFEIGAGADAINDARAPPRRGH